MYKQAPHLLAGLILGIAPMWAAAGISSFVGLGEPTFSEADVQAAFGQGRVVGRQEASAECIGSPDNCGCVDGLDPCGISLSSVLTGAQFGETEPNDHIVAADPLIPETIYWGQSRSLDDEDWFYVTTSEPNQLLTLNFTVPDRVLEDNGNGRLSQGWWVSVRDAAGNVYAQFDTRFALDDPGTVNRDESKEITYPIFLGHVGTYYVVVKPRLADPNADNIVTDSTPYVDALSVLYAPYNLAAVLEFSSVDAAAPDVNFHDVEIEPNDVRGDATRVASGVTMFGLLRLRLDSPLPDTEDPLVGQYLQGEEDWFVYNSIGDEIVTLALCDKGECEEGTWSIYVENEAGETLTFFNTQNFEVVRFGVRDPGNYYLRVSFHFTTDAFCTSSHTELVCNETVKCLEPDALDEDEDGNTDELIEVENCGPDDERLTVVCDGFDEELICDAYGVTINTPEGTSAKYNFTLIGTKLFPNTVDTEAYQEAQERPAWWQNRN